MEEQMTVNQTQSATSDQTAQKSQGQTTGDQTAQKNQGQQGQPATDNQMDKRQARGSNRPEDQNLSLFVSPFALLQRFFTDDMPSLFDDLSGRRGSSAMSRTAESQGLTWMPKIDVVQRGNELVVRADLPGVKPDDVLVEIGDDAITISGQRQQEHAEENGSVYRYERSYGAFLREIPLPPGAMPDQAKASFKDGVLEITVPAPPEQVSRGRRLEISQGADTQGKNKK
jgi:HSP20 family protein